VPCSLHPTGGAPEYTGWRRGGGPAAGSGQMGQCYSDRKPPPQTTEHAPLAPRSMSTAFGAEHSIRDNCRGAPRASKSRALTRHERNLLSFLPTARRLCELRHGTRYEIFMPLSVTSQQQYFTITSKVNVRVSSSGEIVRIVLLWSRRREGADESEGHPRESGEFSLVDVLKERDIAADSFNRDWITAHVQGMCLPVLPPKPGEEGLLGAGTPPPTPPHTHADDGVPDDSASEADPEDACSAESGSESDAESEPDLETFPVTPPRGGAGAEHGAQAPAGKELHYGRSGSSPHQVCSSGWL